MKKYTFILSICLSFIFYCSVFAENVVYGREGNKVVAIDTAKKSSKKDLDLQKKLILMDANLAKKQKLLEGEKALPTFNEHIASTNAHHTRYTDAEAINALQEARDLSIKSINQINAEGGNVKYFEKTKEENNNAGMFIYGKENGKPEEEKFGMIKVNDINGDFEITNSLDKDISIDASNDLNLNSNANGNVVLFRNTPGIEDRNLFIYSKSESFASLGFITGTNDFQIANSKDAGNILLVTRNGNISCEGGLMSTGNIFTNTKGINKDSCIYFYENKDPKGAFIKYSNENKSFEFSSPFFDIAEKLEIDGSVEPGDVVIFVKHYKFNKSAQANSKNIVGVISGRPAFIIGGKEKGKPIALAGQVEVKVCNQNGNIRIGDFLTTSDVPGHAMKSTDMTPGSILGQAMEDFSNDKGKIKMIVKMR